MFPSKPRGTGATALRPATLSALALPAVTGLLALAIFAVDTLSPLGMAIAALYVAVVLLSVNFLRWRGVLLVSAGCAALTIIAYLLQHGANYADTSFARLLVSLAAISIAAILALKNRSATAALEEHARLLDLTHESIFVRRMDDVITYWNRGAEELYGWSAEQAIGKTTHGLLQTVFPKPLEEITAELLIADRWEGELIHQRREGAPLVVSSRWSLERDERGRPVSVLETNSDITDSKRSADRLRQAESELRATIDSIPALVVSVFPDGRLDFNNARWGEQGFAPEQLNDWRKLIHPDDLTPLWETRARSLATGDPFEYEARLQRTDGVYRWYLIRAIALRGDNGEIVKWYSTATDIEDRKRAEYALRRNEALLAQTQKISRTGSIGLNPTTGEVFWSAEAARIFGYDPSTRPTVELLLERMHPDDRWLGERSVERAYRGEPDTEFDFRLLMPDGAIKYVHALLHPEFDSAGEVREVLRALIDVTAARKAEASLHEAQAELAHVARVATLGELTASIAHEVNQPLSAIVANGEASLRWLGHPSPNVEEVRRGLERMIGDAARAGRVIHRIRALSRKTEPERTRLDLNEVIGEVVTLVQREVAANRISLQLDLAAALAPVRGDRVQLQQVIINLMVNGIQAMADLNGRQRVLSVRSRDHEADQVLIGFEDSGDGIAPEHASRLFEAFFTTKPKGMGMGLSICRSIITAHGGRIWFTGGSPGSVFQLTLPAMRENAG